MAEPVLVLKDDGNYGELHATTAGLLKVDIGGSDITLTVDKTGLATSASQSTANTSLASIDTKVPAKGTAVMTWSTPVTVATDDTVLGPMGAAAVQPFQVTLGASQALASHAAKKFVRLIAPISNTNVAYVDPSTGTASATHGEPLNPGDFRDFPVNNSNLLTVFGTTPDVLVVSVY